VNKVGIIGVGAMGRVFALNLLESGYSPVLFNRTPEKIMDLAEKGAVLCDSISDVVKQCSVVILALYDAQAVLQCCQGDNGILSQNLEGKIFLDASTIDIETAKNVSKLISAKKGLYIDTPISGNVEATRLKKSTFLVGASNDGAEIIDNILRGITYNIEYCGEFLKGLKIKLCINSQLFSQWQSFSESLNLAESLGISKKEYIEAMNKSVVSSLFLTQRSEIFFKKSENMATLDLMEKDVLMALELSRGSHIKMNSLEVFHNALKNARELGLEKEDMVVVYYGFKERESMEQGELSFLKREIEKMQDREAIRNLAESFTLSFDEFDLEAYKAQYSQDGYFEIFSEGKSIIKATVSEMDEFFLPRYIQFKENFEQRRHLLTNVTVVKQNEMGAQVITNGLLCSTEKQRELKFVTTIQYYLGMVKEGRDWKLQGVKAHIDRLLD